MTTITTTTLPNGDIQEVRTNPGCAPIVYINGIIQPIATVDYQKSKWQKWFAWHRVKIKDDRVWLKQIYRRVVPASTYANLMSGSSAPVYEYGTIFDVIRDGN